MSIVNMLYNAQLLRYAGEDGVAAYGVLMYVNLVFLAAFIGYSVGTAPVIGYHYGAGQSQGAEGAAETEPGDHWNLFGCYGGGWGGSGMAPLSGICGV